MTAAPASRTFLPAALLAAVAATCFHFSAWASAPGFEARSVKVYLGDLDLTTPSGVSALDTRLATAIRQVCRPVDWRSAGAAVMEAECRARTGEQVAAVRDMRVQQARAGALPGRKAASRIEVGID